MASRSLDLESGPNEPFHTPSPAAQVQFQHFPKPSNNYLRGPFNKRASGSTYSSSSLPSGTANVAEGCENRIYLHPDTTYSNIRIPVPSTGSSASLDVTRREQPNLPVQPEDSLPEPAPTSGSRLLTVDLPAQDSDIQTGDYGIESLSSTPLTYEIFSLIAQVLSFGLSCIYRTRVNRLFLEANLSLGDIKEMVCHTAGDLAQREQFYHLHEISAHPKLPRFEKLLQSWDSFIETTVREWKSLNIVSTLLLTAILTVLQIPGLGDYRPIRYTALVALKCALMSMIFGVAFVIQFSSMRRRYIAAEWALEAQKLRFPFSDVRHLLALPAVWLTWSLILFGIVLEMCVWRENMGDDQAPLVKHLIGLDKIISSLLLVVGLVYFVKVTCCFLNWGQNVEENWKILIDQYYKDSEVQLRQASSLSDIKTTPQKIRRVPQLGSLLTPPPSGATTPQVNVQPATPGSMTPRYSPSRIPTTRALRRLETPESPSGYSPSEQEEPLENEQSCASDTTTPLSPLLMAGGLLLELDKTLNNSATKAASLNNRQFADPLSRSSSVDRHPFNFSPEDFGSSNGEEPESQHRVRRTHTNRLTSLPSPSSANGASLTPTRSY